MFVSVQDLAKNIITFHVKPHDTVYSVKQTIKKKWKVLCDRQKLIFQGKQLNDYSATLSDHSVRDGSVLQLVIRECALNENIQITVKCTKSNNVITLKVKPYETIQGLQTKILKKWGIPVKNQAFVYDGKELVDVFDRNIIDYGIKDDSVVQFSVVRPSPTIRLRFICPSMTFKERSISFYEESSRCIRIVKGRLKAIWGFPYSIDEMQLVHDGRELEDDWALSECDIKEGHDIYLFFNERTKDKQSTSSDKQKHIGLLLFVDQVDGSGPTLPVDMDQQICLAFEQYAEHRKIAIHLLKFRYLDGEIPFHCKDTLHSIGIGDRYDAIDVTFEDHNVEQNIEIRFACEGQDSLEGRPFIVGRHTILRQTLVAFALSLGMPLESFLFRYKGRTFSAQDEITAAELGVNDIGTIIWKPTSWAKNDISAPLQGKVFIAFRDEGNPSWAKFQDSKGALLNPGFHCRLDCGIDQALADYAAFSRIPIECIRFTYCGKILPKDVQYTAAQIQMQEYAEIRVDFALSEDEMLINFEGLCGLNTPLLLAKYTSSIKIIHEELSAKNEALVKSGCNQLKFIYGDKEIYLDCNDTFEELGIEHLSTVSVKIVDDEHSDSRGSSDENAHNIRCKLEDERGEITEYTVNSNSPVQDILTAHAKSRTLHMKSLVFTLRGTDLTKVGDNKISTLGLSDGDIIHVAEKAVGTILTNNSIEIIFGMKGSVDNPSYKPNVQITDLVEAKHRNHWKFTLSDGSKYFHGECAPRLNDLFSSLTIGTIIRLEGFLIRKGLNREKACYVFNANVISAHADTIATNTQNIQKSWLSIMHIACHYCNKITNDLYNCSQCACLSYCSKQCQTKSWREQHKYDCRFYKEYYRFAKKEKKNMLPSNMLTFWQTQYAKDPLDGLGHERAARLCNNLLHISYFNRREMGHVSMLKAHISNAAFLRQVCATSIEKIGNETFTLPYLSDGLTAVSVGKEAIDDYLERNHASDNNIVDSKCVEGAVLVTFVHGKESSEEFHQEIESDLRKVIVNGLVDLGSAGAAPVKYLRLMCNGMFINYVSTSEVLPVDLGMESREKYTIQVSVLNNEERIAQDQIVQFIWHSHRGRKIREILARNIIAAFVLTCHTKSKARDSLAHFIWHHHQLRKARKAIANLIWHTVTRQRRKRCRSSATIIQSLHRGNTARKVHLGKLQPQLEAVRNFYDLWKQPIKQAPTSQQSLSGWAAVREELDLKLVDMLDDEGNLADTDNKLNQALQHVLSVSESGDLEHNEVEVDISELAINDNLTVVNYGVEAMEEPATALEDSSISLDWSQFLVTTHVVKFIQKGDVKFREIFIKRMKQLAKGERSHKLQKPLKGCTSIIYESYLENKHGGVRILWTQEEQTIVVWFIAKHKNVSRLAKLIDDAKNRAARQQLPQTFVEELDSNSSLQVAAKREILLDALGNVPLKLYDVNFDNIDAIANTKNWTPQMHLTDEERKVVEAKGTVLLLGRSGTGKTVCICNRIEYDRQRLGHKQTFSQLFVSRSTKLCTYVEKAVGSHSKSLFNTFTNLVHHLDSVLPQSGSSQSEFDSQQYIDFARFKQDFYVKLSSQGGISALTCWKAIRTFLKGSIEAFQSPSGLLPRAHFVSDQLGKTRCKILSELRPAIYAIFIQYQSWSNEQDLWDDCDRITDLLKRIQYAKKSHLSLYEDNIKRSKIYVDEVQDYVQIEILLFFYIGGGPGALFLAGDPAQSVVEGTDFRFEEVRSVGYFVAGKDKRHLIPEKPKIVNINFRSHAGILACAGGFLDLLFEYFPGSAKQLKKDFGLFKGSRPGVFQPLSMFNSCLHC